MLRRFVHAFSIEHTPWASLKRAASLTAPSHQAAPAPFPLLRSDSDALEATLADRDSPGLRRQPEFGWLAPPGGTESLRQQPGLQHQPELPPGALQVWLATWPAARRRRRLACCLP